MFDRTPQRDHLGPGFSLLRGFGVPVQSPYLLLICSDFPFLHHSVLVGKSSSIDVDITLPSYFLFCKYLLIYLAVPGLSCGVGSFIFHVACGILQLRHAGFFFSQLRHAGSSSLTREFRVLSTGTAREVPPPHTFLSKYYSCLLTFSLPLLEPAPFDSFFKILLECSSKKYIYGHATPCQRFSNISPFLIISLPYLSFPFILVTALIL